MNTVANIPAKPQRIIPKIQLLFLMGSCSNWENPALRNFCIKWQNLYSLQSILKMREIEQKPIEALSHESNAECIICCERTPNVTTNSCSHRFCEICLLRWSKSKRTCPICRTVYTGIKYIKKIRKPLAQSNYVFQQNILLLNYGLSCSNYLNFDNTVIPVFSVTPYLYAANSYYIM